MPASVTAERQWPYHMSPTSVPNTTIAAIRRPVLRKVPMMERCRHMSLDRSHLKARRCHESVTTLQWLMSNESRPASERFRDRPSSAFSRLLSSDTVTIFRAPYFFFVNRLFSLLRLRSNEAITVGQSTTHFSQPQCCHTTEVSKKK